MINPSVNIKPDTNHLLLSKKDFFYRTSIGEELKRVKSAVFRKDPGTKNNNEIEAMNLVIMAESAFYKGNFQAAANFTENASRLLTPLAGFNYRAGDIVNAAFSEELKNFFFRVSDEEIQKNGRSLYTNEVNLLA